MAKSASEGRPIFLTDDEGGQPDMSGFGTDADLMNKAAGQVEEVRSNVDNAVRKMQGDLEPVIASWQGQAATVFRKLMDQFNQNADVITTKLQEISENIHSSGQDYAARDEEQGQELNNLANLMGD